MKNYGNICFLLVCLLLTSQIVFSQSYSYDDSWGNQGVTLLDNEKGGVHINYSTSEFYLNDIDLKGE